MTRLAQRGGAPGGPGGSSTQDSPPPGGTASEGVDPGRAAPGAPALPGPAVLAGAGGPPPSRAPLAVSREGGVLRLSGPLDSRSAGPAWRGAVAAARGAERLDLSGLSSLDTTGAALVLAAEAAAGVEAAGAEGPVAAVLARSRAAARPPPAVPAEPGLPPLARLGRWGVRRWRGTLSGVEFLGEAAATVVLALRRPRDLRASEVLRHLDEVGTRAFPLIALLGVLIGVILAFQSSIPMRQFGAEVFIPRLVGLSLLRELGPLMAAVILAGRTGSAYAAELGTMSVNEEISALRVMGVDPMAMLVLPRLVAATLAMPVLALVMNLAGLLGMTGVMLSLGFPTALVVNQLLASVALGDLLGGLAKAAVFGLVIAGIGCRAGLAAGSGPRAVGDAATAAVVGGIVALVVLDGIFAVLFFRLGW